jgi:hypothetical protein
VAEKVAGLEQRVMVDDFRHPEALLEEMFLVRHELLTVRTMAAQCHDIYGRVTALTGRAVPPEITAAAGRPRRPVRRVRNLSDGEKEFLFASSTFTRPGGHPDDGRSRATRRPRGRHPADHGCRVRLWH